jgi:sugar phosphate isomerase/epimerase
MSKIPIGLQLYSVRADCARDLPGTLKAVADMGYAGVEFAGYHGYSAKDLRKMLDDLGLRCCGTHIGLDTLLGEALAHTVEFNQVLGNPFLIVPGLPDEYTASLAAWRKTAAVFSEIVAGIASQGLRVGYHNHHTEFELMGGELPFDVFFTTAHTGVVMQLDIGNAIEGGADALAFLRRYIERAGTVHLKEHSHTNPNALLGEGEVNWKEVFAICEKNGKTDWYVVEQESYAFPPLECVGRCLENLKKMGKA